MRKVVLTFIALVLFIGLACNFPFTASSRFPRQTKTPDLSIFESLKTQTLMSGSPIPQGAPTNSPDLGYDPSSFTAYTVRSGDTLDVVAAHFSVSVDEILSSRELPTRGLLTQGQILVIPKLSEDTPYPTFLLPDSEVVNSPCGRNFNIEEYVNTANGRLSTYSQKVDSQQLTGAGVVKLVSENTSVNPHLLLAFIEFRSQWVSSYPSSSDLTYPLGMDTPNNQGLFNELSLAAKLLNMGYYGWRQGTLTELTFTDGGSVRISPDLNAGTVAVQYLFARLFRQSTWESALYGPSGFLAIYQRLFGDPWECAQTIEPLFPDGIQPPTLELTFRPG